MKPKQVVTTLLLAYVAASLAVLVAKEVHGIWPAARPEGDSLPLSDGVTVCYFHANTRCLTCTKIEAYAHEAVSAGFPEQFNAGSLRWRVINYEQPGNGHFAADYGIVAPAVVLVERKGGRQTKWKNLDKVWDLLNDEAAFVEHVQAELTGFLGGKPPEVTGQPSMAFLLAAALALWLGILTSVTPCPLATNIAAISYIGRRVANSRQVFLSGLLYTLGRTAVYLVLGIVLVAGLLAIPQLSLFLQRYMNKLLGPIVILVAMFLLGLIVLRFGGGGVSEKLQNRVDTMGIWGAGLLGIVFALSFCPISAGLFFGSLITLSLKFGSAVLLPALYGVGTAVPVIVFAVLIAISAQSVGKAFDRLTQIEWWARMITGLVFLAVGAYYSLRYTFEVF